MPSVKFLVTSRGSAGDPFMPSKPHVPNYLRGRLASLGNDGILELFALNAKIDEIVFKIGRASCRERV